MSAVPVASAIATPARRRRFPALALLILAVSVLLHLALLRSVTHWDARGDDVFLSSRPVVIQLHAAAPTQTPPKPAAVQPAARKKAKPPSTKPRPKPAPAPELAPTPESDSARQSAAPQALADAGTAADSAVSSNTGEPTGEAAGPAADTAPVEPIALAQPEPSAKALTPIRTLAPPSALLSYSVRAQRSEGNVEGTGSIRFTRNEDSYSVEGEVKVLFMSLLSFQSNGQLDAQGLAPLLYTEKRFRKSSTNTHFQRERQRVSFSASTLSYPRSGLEQDRASIIWQLAALGRGDAAQLAPGSELDIFVAGTRDGDVWRLQVTGEENIQAAGQTLRALHVLRQPRPGSYDQRLDIWLAPGLQWYPVKLRFTEANGDVLDLSLNDAQQTPSGN